MSVFVVFLVRFYRIWTEYGEILRISSYSVRMRKIQTRKTPNTNIFHAVHITFKKDFKSLLFVFILKSKSYFEVFYIQTMATTTTYILHETIFIFWFELADDILFLSQINIYLTPFMFC